MRHFLLRLTLSLVFTSATALLAAGSNSNAADADDRPKVAASIRPIHSIVASIMQGVDEPALIVKDSQSPHHANLKPSQASVLAKAEMLFWIGPGLEGFLQKPINATAKQAQVFALADIAGLELRLFPDGQPDPHIWLSVDNAITIARFTTGKLIEADPHSAGTYRENLAQFLLNMNVLQLDLQAILASQKNHHFLIYHDALLYLEKKFQFHTRAIYTGNEEITAGARQIVAIRKLIQSRNFQCLLAEPNINASAIITMARDNNIPVAVLDPLGSDLPTGPDLYSQLMRNIATTIANCAQS